MKRTRKKLLSLLLAAVMLLGLLPMGALAADGIQGQDERTVPLSSRRKIR